MKILNKSVVITTLLGVLCLIPGLDSKAHGSVIMTYSQVGNDVFVSGSGSLNLTALRQGGVTSNRSSVFPSFPLGSFAVFGTTNSTSNSAYDGIAGPASFGSGSQTFANSGSGDTFGVIATRGIIYVPLGYTSGAALSATSTFNNQTIAGLGLTPGTYQFTWGTGLNADFLQLTINSPGSSVPEPSSILLLGLPLGALIIRRRNSVQSDTAANRPFVAGDSIHLLRGCRLNSSKLGLDVLI